MFVPTRFDQYQDWGMSPIIGHRVLLWNTSYVANMPSISRNPTKVLQNHKSGISLTRKTHGPPFYGIFLVDGIRTAGKPSLKCTVVRYCGSSFQRRYAPIGVMNYAVRHGHNATIIRIPSLGVMTPCTTWLMLLAAKQSRRDLRRIQRHTFWIERQHRKQKTKTGTDMH